MVEQEEVKWNLLRNRILSTAAERAQPNSTLGKIFAKSSGIVDQKMTPKYLKEVRQGKLTIFLPDNFIPHTISEITDENDNCLYTKMKEPFYSLPCFFFMRKGLNATIKTLFSKTYVIVLLLTQIIIFYL
ncbi:hypothetical protein Avbf_10103 [Armadillidium vulgare]|nr:hypothetical protein Avbf_10103 [Armadillidium vulgare]